MGSPETGWKGTNSISGEVAGDFMLWPTGKHRFPELALRLALCSHIRLPNENEIDHLAEVEKVFAPKPKKPTVKKKAVKKPTPAKGKIAKKKASK
jgi:hypothetical protein